MMDENLGEQESGMEGGRLASRVYQDHHHWMEFGGAMEEQNPGPGQESGWVIMVNDNSSTVINVLLLPVQCCILSF